MKATDEEIKERFADGLTVFGNLLDYSFFTGRFAYGSGQPNESDIDIVTVLKPEAQKLEAGEMVPMVKKFVEAYLQIHRDSGFRPDLFFPGEVVSGVQISDAVGGRGYSVDETGAVSAPAILDDADWTPEFEYRAWRCMSAFNNGRLVAGNPENFNAARKAAWKSILTYMMLRSPQVTPETLLKDIVKGGETFFGISELYEPGFSSAEYAQAAEAISDLAKASYLHAKNGFFIPDQKRLSEWESHLTGRLSSGRWSGWHLFPWEEIRRHANHVYDRLYH